MAVGAGCLNDGGGGGDGPDGYGSWFDGVDNYDGFVDRTGTDRTTVEVGADDGLAFAPAAIEVSPGTTVVWEWVGRGGSHNVKEDDGAFLSDYYQKQGSTFEHTFDEAGTFPYYCVPHQNQGMKGGVTVVEESTTAASHGR
nr:halocyanin domain-containing protein [Halomarina salina]